MIPVTNFSHVCMFFVEDPDGTPIEVIEYPGEAQTSEELWRG